MAKRPNNFMPMYWGDYHRDTGHLNAAEHGAYMLLIGHYWTRGEPVNGGEEQKRRIARMSVPEWKRSRDVIAALFNVDGEVWRHKRIDEELARAAAQYARRRDGASYTNGQRYGKPSPSDTPSASPMESPLPLPLPSSNEDPPTPKGGRLDSRELDLQFERWWALMPKRGSGKLAHPNPKQPARLKWMALVKSGKVTIETLSAAARATAYSVTQLGIEPRGVAQAITWLNQARWEQYAPDESGHVNGAGPPSEERLAMYRARMAEFRAGKPWPKFLGPKPGEPGCTVPPEVLAEFPPGPKDPEELL